MITRIVKLTFKESEIDNFLKIFEKQQTFIASFEGCTHLELLRDKNNPNVFFTYSYWIHEEYLALYRKSNFFNNIWSQVKPMFDDKPKAWSVEKIS